MNQIGFSMVSIYLIGAILFVAVGVLGSALAIAWRDANRDHRRVTPARTEGSGRA